MSEQTIGADFTGILRILVAGDDPAAGFGPHGAWIRMRFEDGRPVQIMDEFVDAPVPEPLTPAK